MGRLLRLIFLLLCCAFLEGAESEPVCILNELNRPYHQPQNFRTVLSALHSCHAMQPSTMGLKNLRISGSGQFSAAELGFIKNQLCGAHLTIVDLRQESHGFVNGMAISWFAARDTANRGQTLEQIDADERSKLADMLKQGRVTIFSVVKKGQDDNIVETVDVSFKAVSVAQEQQVCASQNVGYIRIPVRDHTRPSDAEVERFLDFLKTLPEGMWLHFHCAEGWGRTTTFMCMYDMLRNAKKVSLDDILKRQHMLGGKNMLALPAPSDWTYPNAQARLDFLRRFYAFCKETDPLKSSWSTYLNSNAAALK